MSSAAYAKFSDRAKASGKVIQYYDEVRWRSGQNGVNDQDKIRLDVRGCRVLLAGLRRTRRSLFGPILTSVKS